MKNILITIIVSLISSASFYIIMNSYATNSSIKQKENNIILSNTGSSNITDIKDYTGYYSMKLEPGYEGEFTIKIADEIGSKTDGRIYFLGAKGAPSYNTGEIRGKITLNNGEIEYEKYTNEGLCHFVGKLNLDKLKITMLQGNDSTCELGAGVYPDGEYIKKSGAKPMINLSDD